jgi:cytidylate kinase
MAGHRNALHTACEEQQVATAEALIFGGIDVTTKVFNSTAVDKIRDAEAKERLERAIQQMEEPGLK